MRSALFLTLLSMLFAFGCANETGDPTDDPMLGDDDDDVGTPGAACADIVPSSNFDVIVGSNLNPFALPLCNGEGEFDIYGDSFCSEDDQGDVARPAATFVGMAAGWCIPCRNETDALVGAGGLAAEYGPKGIRFVQVVIHDNTFGNPADMDFCQEWVDEYNPSYPTVVNTTLVDVEANVLKGRGLPYSVIIDRDGRIVEATTGWNPRTSPEVLSAQFDELIAEAEAEDG